MSKYSKVTFRVIDLIIVFVMIFGATGSALAKVWTDLTDYLPGSTVTIRGDNSDADTAHNWRPGETVHVDVVGPNGYTASCEDVTDNAGAWTCDVTLWNSLLAVGKYTYTATGLTSGNIETGIFTDSQENYLHWLDGGTGWANTTIQHTNSAYFEGEVVPQYFESHALTAGQTYAFNIYYDYYYASNNGCGFTYFDDYNASRSPTVPATTPPAGAPTQDNALPEGHGYFFTTGADITNVSAPFDFGDGKQRYVQVTFTASQADVAFYWGFHLAIPGEIDSCSGAHTWPGASLQTNVSATPVVTGATMLGGGGTMQINPSGAIAGRISGYKWNDLNANGTMDGAEVKLAGWTINLCSDSACVTVLQTTTTDTSGNYTFAVTPGTYYVREVLQSGWRQTAPASNIYGPLTINATTPTFTANNFGNQQLGTIIVNKTATGGDATFAYTTTSGDGFPAGFNITTSGGSGSRTYNNIVPGTFSVAESPLSGWTLTGSSCTTGTPASFSVTPGGTVTCTFNNIKQAPALSLVKRTNGTDNNTAPGPYLVPGSTVTWTYVVTNTGNTTLTNVTVTDNMITSDGTVIDCGGTSPNKNVIASMAPGASVTCTATGTAITGQYTNTGSVTGTPPAGTPPTASDPDNYFGQSPAIDIVKRTNGSDGLNIPVGNAVTWTYVVKNTSNVALSNVTVTDNMIAADGTAIDCGGTDPNKNVIASLAANDGAAGGPDEHTCTATGTAVVGTYNNIGSVTGTPPVGDDVSDNDPSSYFGVTNGISLVKKTNGTDNNAAPGPYVVPGSTVTWTYVVTNTGNAALSNVTVTDNMIANDATIVCEGSTNNVIASLAAGASKTCTATSTAITGQYTNTGSATGTPPAGTPPTATDPDNYLGVTGDLVVVKTTNSTDNNSPTGANVAVGSTVTWSYTVTNNSNAAVSGIVVKDDNGTPANTADDITITCPKSTLAAGESMTCTAVTGTAVAGQYSNIGSVSGTDAAGQPKSDTDPDHYFGVTGNLDLMKTTNATDNNSPTGPKVTVGSTVTWGYTVTNNSNAAVSGIVVKDDNGTPANTADDVTVTCPKTTLAAGESMTCTATGTAGTGQYTNIGTVTGTDAAGEPVSATDPDNYFGVSGNLALVKKTNGTDNNSAPGVYVVPGSTVTWTYLVTNNSNATVSAIALKDNNGTPANTADDVTVTCPKTTLAAGESMICTATGTAVTGQYTNIGTVTGTDAAGEPVSATDPDHYFGVTSGLTLVKKTNGTDNNTAPGPYVVPGSTVTWTYMVTNIGNTTLTNVTVTDNMIANDATDIDCGGTPKNVIASLAAGASKTCTATGIAIAGQYSNIGSATGTPPAGIPPTTTDPDNYFGSNPAIDVEKFVKNGAGDWQDADTVKGPYLNPGVNPEFKFVVINIGNIALSGITLVDNTYTISSCTIPATLAPKASFECLLTGTWAAGQHTNTATATGTFNAAPTSDSDPANYFGVVPVVSKTANGTFEEVHDWEVFKSVDAESQNAYAGQKVDFTWTVRVSETTQSENRLVTGVITVINPNPDDPMSMSLNDTLSDGSVATISSCTGGTWSNPNLSIPAGSTATCNYSVVPTGEADLAALEAALPDSATINVHRGVNSYFDSTISNGGILDGTYEGWCVDGRHGIMEDQDYTANVFSSYETLPAGVFDHPENFDLVNWIINQHFVGKSAGNGLGDYTRNDVQKAIWDLLQDNITTTLSYDEARVAQIKAAAASHDGFKPSCGDLVAVIFQPLGGKQVTIVQMTFASLGVDCANSNAVTAVVNGFQFPASAEIVWTPNPVNPTATLTDSQNPAWPTIVTANTIFTYKDPQGYTCPAKSSSRSWEPTTYTESNEAMLIFSTGSVSSSATTTVMCEEYMPGLKLVKSATPTTYNQVGDVINYSYLVKNTGNVAFAGPVKVTDDKVTVTCPAGGLAINATMTCSATYKITQADIDYGTVENTAFASTNGTNSNTDAKTVELVKDPQTITVTKHAPESAADKTSFSVAATGGASGNPIVYSASGACTNIGAVFTMTGSTGTCIVHYNQAGNAGYEAAAEVTEVVNATKAAQVITFTSTAPVNAMVFGAKYTPSASASSSLPVTITVDASASSVCYISGGMVSFIRVGTCVLNANQGGNVDYAAAAQVQQSFVVKGPAVPYRYIYLPILNR